MNAAKREQRAGLVNYETHLRGDLNILFLALHASNARGGGGEGGGSTL
jgi:hypothetical protein